MIIRKRSEKKLTIAIQTCDCAVRENIRGSFNRKVFSLLLKQVSRNRILILFFMIFSEKSARGNRLKLKQRYFSSLRERMFVFS